MGQPVGPVATASQGRALTSAIAVTTVCVLPVFLTGGLAVQMRADLGFGTAALGLAVSAFFGAAALSSVLCGRVVERVGARRGMVAAAVLSALSLVGIGALASSWAHLMVFLALAGIAQAASHPATNLLLTGAMRRHRLGLALGVKQAAIPAATLLGGLATPLLGLTVGWRFGFLLGALVALGIGAIVARSAAVRPQTADGARVAGSARIAPLLLPTLGIGLGAAAGVSLAAFLVDAAVAGGVREGAAGLLLAAASVAGVVVRAVTGWLADRRPRNRLRAVAAMLVAGAAGFALLATGSPGWPLVVGALLGFGAGWGWPGLFHFAIVDLHREAPAAATGITQTGTYAGSAVGPLVFGLVVEHASYTAAWLCSAGLVLVAAAAMLGGRGALVRDRRRRMPGADAGGGAVRTAAGG